MNHKDTLAQLQFNIVEKLAFCPMPPHTYNEIAELFQQLSDHLNTNFEVKEEKISKALFKEVTKELEKAINKNIEYEQVNLRLNTIILALKQELSEVKTINEELLNDKNKLQVIIEKRLKEIDELKSQKSPIDIESILETQQIFNKSIHHRVDTLEKIVHSIPLPTKNNPTGMEHIIEQLRKQMGTNQ